MPTKPNSEALTCMSCGIPIKSGFFCPRCGSGEEPPAKKDEGWKGSRFSGEAKKKRQQKMLADDLTMWGKRLIILVILGGIGFTVYSFWGDQIMAWASRVGGASAPKEKYDPTKDSAADVDDQGTATGTRAFTKQAK